MAHLDGGTIVPDNDIAASLNQAAREAPGEHALSLRDGARVGIVGGGPAGSFFAYFLLETAERVGLSLEVDIYEARDFDVPGPAGCNMCGGVVSESMVQTLATEGIVLPRSVVQRGLDSYVIHSPEGRVRLDMPNPERRIAAMHRGAGPKGAVGWDWESFDGFLLRAAEQRGATVRHARVKELGWEGDLPRIATRDGDTGVYELLVGAAGVNSAAPKLFSSLGVDYAPPKTGRTYVAELHVGQEWADTAFGGTMHVFMLNIPRLEFGGLLPKADYLTLVLVGEDVDDELVDRFLQHPEVRRCLPEGWTVESRHCQCRPKMNVRGVPKPYADRVVLLGDCGITRLNKDGIGAAYRAAKAAAVTAVFHGVSAEAFEGHYMGTASGIRRDNAYGRMAFGVAGLVQAIGPTRRGMMRMVATEQGREGGGKAMSDTLWDMFTGSAAYKQVFLSTLKPSFVVPMLGHAAVGLVPGAAERRLEPDDE
jgi:flavin-dependent dehydrogenase